MPTNEDEPVPERTPPGDTVVEEVRVAGEKVTNHVREQAAARGGGHRIAGAVLIVLGMMFLLDRFSWVFHWPHWLRFANLWPLILVAIGVALLTRAHEERA